MNTQINQEIILLTDTHLADRELYRIDDNNNEGQSASNNDKLERACWDGLLDEMLPEVTPASDGQNKNFIWQIISAENFICIHRGSWNTSMEKEFSIDPNLFVNSLLSN